MGLWPKRSKSGPCLALEIAAIFPLRMEANFLVGVLVSLGKDHLLLVLVALLASTWPNSARKASQAS